MEFYEKVEGLARAIGVTTSTVKKYYGASKVNFDTIIKDLHLKPIFNGSIDDLQIDYKTFGIKDFMVTLQNYHNNCLKLDKKISSELSQIFAHLKDIASQVI